MPRPIWLWVVFLLSLIYFLTGLLGGSFALYIQLYPEKYIKKIEEMNTFFHSIPGAMEAGAQLDQLDQSLEQTKTLLKQPGYRMTGTIFAVIKIMLALGFLFGAISLFRLRLAGVSLLKAVYYCDLVIAISSMLLMHHLEQKWGAIPPGTVSGGTLSLMMIGGLLLNFLLDGIPLLCLHWGDKSALE